LASCTTTPQPPFPPITQRSSMQHQELPQLSSRMAKQGLFSFYSLETGPIANPSTL